MYDESPPHIYDETYMIKDYDLSCFVLGFGIEIFY